MSKKEKIFVGCSGWNYKHWKGTFYPEELSTGQWFHHYAEIFRTVEINNTFYNLPDEKVFQKWAEQADRQFIYSVKASRYITHMKKLKEAGDAVDRFLKRVRALGRHLGPILYQLPPRWKNNPDRLREFLQLLPGDIRPVFEFRDQSWLNEEIFEILDEHEAEFCTHDMKGLEVPRLALGPLAYVRLHGYQGKYQGKYPEPSLCPWAKWLKEQADQGRAVYVYFNNDQRAFAVENARQLQKKLTGSRDR